MFNEVPSAGESLPNICRTSKGNEMAVSSREMGSFAAATGLSGGHFEADKHCVKTNLH